MVSSWIEEGSEELLSRADELLAESRKHIGASNELGRALCAAFLREAAA